MFKISSFFKNIIVCLGAISLIIIFLSCQSFGQVSHEPAPVQQRTPEEIIARMNELQQQIDEGNIFVGNEPARTSTIGILRPSNPSSGQLSPDEIWYLDMIRSAMSSNFTRFASDRILVVNLSEDVVRALEDERNRSLDVNFEEENYLRITALIPARAIMTSEIIKQSANRFYLSFTVTETETGRQLASYNQSHSDIEIVEGIAVNRATENLLRQLNVILNDAGRHALLGASNEADVALARGLEAADAGQSLQAMNYLFNASHFSYTANQANMTLATVQTQNQAELLGAGARVMDFFQRRELWQSRLNEFNSFYSSNSPFELIYTRLTPSNMRVSGTWRTYDLHFSIGLRWNQNQMSVMERVLQEYILDGLYANPPEDIRNWDLRGLPEDSQLFRGPDNFIFNIVINVENERGDIITSGSVELIGSLFRYQGRLYARSTQEVTVSFDNLIYIEELMTEHLYIRVVSVNGTDINTVGETGFMRVAQTQDNRLPPIQPDTLPRSLVNELQSVFAASEREAANRERARERQLREEERLRQEEQRRLQQEQQRQARQQRIERERRNDHLRELRLSLASSISFIEQTDAGRYSIDLGLGGGRFDLEAGFTGYFGTEKNIYHPVIASDPYVYNIRLGLGYVYVTRFFLFRVIPGVSLYLLETDDITGESEDTEMFVGGNIQTMVDINPFRRGGGGLFLRLGHRLDYYSTDLAVIFGEYRNKGLITSSFFAGFAWYLN